MKTPHLAHVVLGLPFGGTEVLVDRMLRNPPQGFRVSCICLDFIGELGERLIQDGITVHLAHRKPGLDLGLAWRLAKLAQQHRIDVFHCHQYTPFFYGALAKIFKPELGLVFTEHGRFHPDLPSPKRRVFNRLLHGKANTITAVSPAVKTALVDIEGFPPERVEMLYNGIAFTKPQEDKAALRKRLGLDPEGFYFILCARFDPIKWIPGLIEAFRIVLDAHPKAGLVLVGEGPEKETILARGKALGLEERVVMPGFQRNVPEWLSACDAFVLCSLNEGTSVSLIESMATGLPSVVTRVGGNPFVVEEGKTGLIVPSMDAKALGAAMLELARNPERGRAMGAVARTRYEERFLPEAMDRTYADQYRKSLQKA